MLIELGCTELGIAWRAADLPALPALFTVRDRDRQADENAWTRLAALGLIDPRGALSSDLHQAMTAFAQSPVEVDLRFATGSGTEVRAAVATADDTAFLAVVTGGHVRFSRVPAEAAVTALVRVLPPEQPAAGTLVSLPVAEVDTAITGSMERGVDADEGVIDGLAARGVARTDARLFVSLVGSKRLRFAEFGVTFRDRAGARRRSGRTVQVVDMRRGRAVLHTRGDYLVAAPADGDTVVRVLTELRDAELDRNRLG
ncbi:MAG TPA: ESX secretion-associated protein EspG [Pseudonocardiaceae bacterium]|nr:ESX secretion-associated protein EspG [Pseudonocardiaceae bacterium]